MFSLLYVHRGLLYICRLSDYVGITVQSIYRNLNFAHLPMKFNSQTVKPYSLPYKPYTVFEGIWYLDAIICSVKPLFYMIIMVSAHHLIVFLLRNIFHVVLSNAGNDHYWIIKTKPQVWMKIYNLKMHSIVMYQMIEIFDSVSELYELR